MAAEDHLKLMTEKCSGNEASDFERDTGVGTERLLRGSMEKELTEGAGVAWMKTGDGARFRDWSSTLSRFAAAARPEDREVVGKATSGKVVPNRGTSSLIP